MSVIVQGVAETVNTLALDMATMLCKTDDPP